MSRGRLQLPRSARGEGLRLRTRAPGSISARSRALGTRERVEVDVRMEDAWAGDVVLLCTDRLSTVVTDEEIARVLAGWSDAEATAAAAPANPAATAGDGKAARAAVPTVADAKDPAAGKSS